MMLTLESNLHFLGFPKSPKCKMYGPLRLMEIRAKPMISFSLPFYWKNGFFVNLVKFLV